MNKKSTSSRNSDEQNVEAGKESQKIMPGFFIRPVEYSKRKGRVCPQHGLGSLSFLMA